MTPLGLSRNRRKTLIGHRGASAYAPEHTLASYELAVRQGADCVEQDLHVTRDAVLVCLHDRTLERTTDVRHVFPNRGRDLTSEGTHARHWFVHDFTIDELKELDAGSWFSAEFAGARIPTFEEVITWAGDRTALLAELKDPDVYETLGIDLLALFDKSVRARPASTASSMRQPRVTLQTFHEPTVRRAAETLERQIPCVLLIEPGDAAQWSERRRIEHVATFAAGIGPGKSILERHPEVVGWAHDAGLRVTPWTFRSADAGRFGSVRAEMAHHLSVLDVDGVITDHPDQCSRELLGES